MPINRKKDQQIVTCYKEGGMFNDPADAVAYANTLGASGSNFITVEFGAGLWTYDMDQGPLMPGQYVGIKGQGEYITEIRGTNGVVVGRGANTITAATNVNPAVFTCSSTANLNDGQQAFLFGFEGGTWDEINVLNGTLNVLTGTTFSITGVSGAGLGTYTSGTGGVCQGVVLEYANTGGGAANLIQDICISCGSFTGSGVAIYSGQDNILQGKDVEVSNATFGIYHTGSNAFFSRPSGVFVTNWIYLADGGNFAALYGQPINMGNASGPRNATFTNYGCNNAVLAYCAGDAGGIRGVDICYGNNNIKGNVWTEYDNLYRLGVNQKAIDDGQEPAININGESFIGTTTSSLEVQTDFDTDGGTYLFSDCALEPDKFTLNNNTSYPQEFLDFTNKTIVNRKLVREITATDTAELYDTYIVCNTASNITVNLPAAADAAGKELTIKNINTGVVTVNGSGAETIDDETTQDLNQYDAMKIVSDGTEWWVV